MALGSRLDRLDRRLVVRPGDGRDDTLRSVPLRSTEDVLLLLEAAAGAALADRAAEPLDRARTLGYLAATALKVLEVRDLAGRVQALEAVLRERATVQHDTGEWRGKG